MNQLTGMFPRLHDNNPLIYKFLDRQDNVLKGVLCEGVLDSQEAPNVGNPPALARTSDNPTLVLVIREAPALAWVTEMIKPPCIFDALPSIDSVSRRRIRPTASGLDDLLSPLEEIALGRCPNAPT